MYLILAFLLSFSAFADDTVEAMYGAYIMHFKDINNISRRYENRSSRDSRLVNNRIIGLGFGNVTDKSYVSNYVFHGEDSIGAPITGFSSAFGYRFKTLTRVGLAFGGYFMENERWEKKGINHPADLKVSDRFGFVPLIGIDISQEIPLSKDSYLKINNLITPAVSTHSLSLGFRY